jgi:hypothetical protein
MTPEQLIRLLTELGTAADVVDCIDDPTLQRLRGWDLASWRYRLVPWGVVFSRQPDGTRVIVAGEPHARTAVIRAEVLA